jgi:ketosteroid isomerase-like protein
VSDIDDLIAADAGRRAALVAGDVGLMMACLADDLSWTHSSGKTDSKAGFVATMLAGTTIYHSLDVRDLQARAFGNVFVLEGVVFGDVTKEGQDRKLVNRFITVWRKRLDGSFALHAWQSTGLV